MPQVAEPTGQTGMNDRAARHRSDGPDQTHETAGRVRGRGITGWVLLVLASLVYAAVSVMLAPLAVGLLPLAAESPVQGYLRLLIAVTVAGLATGFTAGLRGLVTGIPMLSAVVLGSVMYGVTEGAGDAFLAAVTAGSAGALLGVIVADRRGAPSTAGAGSTTAPSRPGGLAWTIAAVAVPALGVLAMYLALAMDLAAVGFAVTAAVVVLVALGTGACIAQARQHFGREPRWGLSMFLGVVAGVIALYASYIIAATVDYARF